MATQLSIADKIAAGIKKKEEGNDSFKQGNYIDALRKYHEALFYLSGLGDSDVGGLSPSKNETTTSQKAEIKKTLSIIYSNMAACHHKNGKYSRVVDCSKTAIEMSGENIKAYYRRAEAYFELKDLDKARQDLVTLLKLDPQNAAAIQLQAKVVQKEKQNEEKRDKVFRGMFSRSNK